jgi:hypothetical protein
MRRGYSCKPSADAHRHPAKALADLHISESADVPTICRKTLLSSGYRRISEKRRLIEGASRPRSLYQKRQPASNHKMLSVVSIVVAKMIPSAARARSDRVGNRANWAFMHSSSSWTA